MRDLGRPVLDRVHIGRAVKEILGNAWFDLPFDTENSLRDWHIDQVLTRDPDLRHEDMFVHVDWEYGDDDDEEDGEQTRHFAWRYGLG